MSLYPLKFRPILKTVVWGGEKIAPFKGIETDQHNIGESWELSGVRNAESVVDGGELDGRTITSLIEEYREQLIGRKNFEKTGTEFPLLIKFIDARQDLSIQVHPDDELAAKRHDGSKGKTEMWYVISADEKAHLMSGLSEKITPEEYAAKVADNTITDVLHDYDVNAGDVFFLPAGRIHSIGSGCFIAEIQQTSDITYRIYDFGRVGLNGKPRELHTELSKDAIDYTVLPDYRTGYTKEKDRENVLVDCSYFTTSLYDLDRGFAKDLSDLDSFLIVICTAGNGVLKDDKGNEVSLKKGETVLVPADTKEVVFTPAEGGMEFLTSCVR